MSRRPSPSWSTALRIRALQNGLVTFDSLTLALLDPTNATLVAAAVAGAQASAASASGSASSAAASAASSLTQALAAAASAATVNLSPYLPKAGNLADLGNVDTALANLTAAKLDGTNVTGRLASVTGSGVVDWKHADNKRLVLQFGCCERPRCDRHQLSPDRRP